MRKGFMGYVTDVSEALKSMSVTDIKGQPIIVEESIERFVKDAKRIRDGKGIFFFAGNGASASMAEHMSHDFFQNGDFLTMTVSETAHLTAISNDISYDEVFAYRIEKALSEKDAIVTISSSGNSPNIIRAIGEARKKGMFIVTLSGMKPDNKSKGLGDLNFYVPVSTYGMVESAHATLLHYLLDAFLDKYMGGRH